MLFNIIPKKKCFTRLVQLRDIIIYIVVVLKIFILYLLFVIVIAQVCGLTKFSRNELQFFRILKMHFVSGFVVIIDISWMNKSEGSTFGTPARMHSS